MANLNYPKTLSFSTTIPFDQPLNYMPQQTISGALTFVKNTTGAYAGYGTMLRLVADGAHTPDFSDFAATGVGSWVNTSGTVNQVFFFYDGSQFCVVISQPGSGGTGAVLTQLNTPGSFAAALGGAGQVVLTWTDTNTSPNEVGYRIYFNAINDFGSAAVATTTAANATTYTKSGLSTGPWYFWILAVGDGTTTGNSNTATANATVTSGSTTLNAPTGVTLGTATSTTQPLTWTDTNSSPNENGYKVYFNTVNTFGSATLATTTAANATSYTVTGLTASTLYYYWIVAAGNGTTTADSSPSTVQSGSTGSAATLVDLTLSTNDGYTNTSQVFTVTAGGSGWGNRGLDPKKLASGTDGYIQVQRAASDQMTYLFGFNFVNALQAALSGGGFDMGFYLDGTGNLQRMQSGGIVDLTTAVNVGDYVRIVRTGSTVKLQTSPDATTWTDRYTYTNATTADLFIVSDINGAGKLGHPKGYNVV